MQTNSSHNVRTPDATTGAVRAIIGLAQGLALYALHYLHVTHETVLRSELTFLLLIPTLAVISLGHMPARVLAGWLITATCLVVGIQYYQALGDAGVVGAFAEPFAMFTGHLLTTTLPLLPILFIAQVLLTSAVADGRMVATYPTYFDTSWKQGFQFVLAWCFVGLFWAVLGLGSSLFSVIGVGLFRELISKSWFGFPATCVAFALAIHLTDVSPKLLIGVRRTSLGLQAILLPLLVAIGAGFLFFLLSGSLPALRLTKHGATILSWSAFALVWFTNVAYQQGPRPLIGERQAIPAYLRWPGSLVGPMALIMVILAAYGSWLRVGEYGWTTTRILGVVAEGIAALYAIGYSSGGLWGSTPNRRFERTNVIAAVVVIVVGIALLSPLADPARLVVQTQLSRLRSHAVTPEQFDFAALGTQGRQYGKTALAELSQSSDPAIAKLASAAKTAGGQPAMNGSRANPNGYLMSLTTHEEIMSNLSIFPASHPLPPDVVDLFRTPQTPGFLLCFKNRAYRCAITFVSDPTFGEMAFVVPDTPGPDVAAIQRGADGKWSYVASYGICEQARTAMKDGTFSLARPVLPDLMVGSLRAEPRAKYACPPPRAALEKAVAPAAR